MTFRALLAALPALLLACVLWTAASCNVPIVSHPLADGGLGGPTSASASSGTGGAGSGAHCGGEPRCTHPSDCPSLSSTCVVNTCEMGCCGVTKAAAGTHCADSGGTTCDGMGSCVAACQQASDCPSTTKCVIATCTGGKCGATDAAQGTGCNDGGGTTCDGKGHCVAQGQCPMGMTEATIPGASSYCIDSVEVTYGQYLKFYDANFPFSIQPPYCSWNQDWTPKSPPITPMDAPVAVNWCQADAYCRSHVPSLHLCGKVGGGPVPQESFMLAGEDQWFNACSQHGNFAYPYGDTYDPGICNGSAGADGGSPGPGPAAGWPMCGPMALQDMSGNVAEWEDSCDGTTGAADNCAIRGGSYLDGPSLLRCDSGGTLITRPRNYAGAQLDVGFRCCL